MFVDKLSWEPEKRGKQRRAAIKHELRNIIVEEIDSYEKEYENV